MVLRVVRGLGGVLACIESRLLLVVELIEVRFVDCRIDVPLLTSMFGRPKTDVNMIKAAVSVVVKIHMALD